MRYIPNVHMEPWHPMQAVMGSMVTTADTPLGRISQLQTMALTSTQAAKVVVAASYVNTAIRKMMEETVE